MQLRNRSLGDSADASMNINDEEEALIEQDEGTEPQSNNKKGLAGDEKNILVLLFLYILQGIPLGLAAAIPLILTNRNVSYKQQAEFSFAYWPFSVKLLWAPIVDSCFISSFGRRKTWLVPVQYLIGVTMMVLSYKVDYYLGDGDDNAEPNVTILTAMFFFLNFLAATQDIAVDGWALTMLQRHNVGYASTCNSVGQTAGYFMGYVFFMGLESYGLVTLAGFLQFWAIVFVVATTLVAVLKSENMNEENSNDSDEADLGVVDTYKLLLDIIKLRLMPVTIAMLLTAKIGFAAADSVSSLKLIEAGVPKDKLAMLAIPMIPLQIILPWIISRYTSGPRPMDVFVAALPVRLVLCLVTVGVVYITPTFKLLDGSFPLSYYCLLVAVYGIYQVALYSMFVSIMAFFAKISDPAVGGTYMTLLNTLTNLGGNWPSTLALWMVDPLTIKQCTPGKNTTIEIGGNTCSNTEEVDLCKEAGASCETRVDGYYVECGICFVIGMVWLVLWGARTINRLTDAPDKEWRVVGTDKKK